MTETTLKAQVKDEMKVAMRAKDKVRLGAIRLIQAEIKRIEVDERIEIDDARLLLVLDKMCKQRRDSIQQYQDANRQELADVEIAELAIIQEFLPAQLSEDELSELISSAVAETGALEKLMPELFPLEDKSIANLEHAAALGKPATVIFALLLFQCKKDNAKILCQRLKIPNEFKDLALLVSNFGFQCQSPVESAEQLLKLVEQLDPFRRPERFELFLQCCELYFNEQHCSSQLRLGFQLCDDINAALLAAEGLSGKAIGQALRQRRLEAIDNALFQ
jgi:uncharacterized protein YqeY